jgi:thioredoxin 1
MKNISKNIFLLMLLSMFSLIGCSKDAEVSKTESVMKAEEVQELPKLLDLGAKKCIPCKMMAPILDELTTKYEGIFDVEFIDVWQPENKEKARQYGIRTIPTQIFFDAKGKELWRHEGFISKEDILKKWEELGYDMKSDSGSKENESSKFELWQPVTPYQRYKSSICYLSDATIDPKNMVTVATPQGNIHDIHHLFILYTSLREDNG